MGPPKQPPAAIDPGPAWFGSRGAPASAASGPSPVPFDPQVFGPDPVAMEIWSPEAEAAAYAGKYPRPTQRPWVEWGRGLYLPGPIPPSSTLLGETNLMAPHFLVYGDYRSGGAYIRGAGGDKWVWANRLNLDLDWKPTATERLHAFWGPLDRGAQFTRIELDGGDFEFLDNFDDSLDALYFEGDLGALWGGITGRDSPWDLPVTIGRIPLFFQNGIWLEDAVTGAAISIPARNSPWLDLANYDITFFAGWDDIDSPVLPGDDVGDFYGAHTFIDAWGGYFEAGYAFVNDRSGLDADYHNLGISFTRRYAHRVSTSLRYIVNLGQSPAIGDPSADGHLVLLETAWITSRPQTWIPYANLFAGFDRPQSVARSGVSGGPLRNTGINFETDGLTGRPLLNDTAQNTFGGAFGVNLLGPTYNYQLVLEAAWLQAFGDPGERLATGNQYGLGMRYQLPLTHAWLLRVDMIHAFIDHGPDLSGVLTELRWKF